MIDCSDWAEAQLVDLIAQGVRERDDLEYKQSDALRVRPNISRDEVASEVSKDVSAMANASGGILIYGIVEKHHTPVRLDGGFELGKQGEPTHEWLEKVIRGNVRPAPEELFIRAIDLSGSMAGRVAILVCVGQDPHGCQASDRRYYRRRNFQNEALEDWEVRELMARAKSARVELVQHHVVVSKGGAEGALHSYSRVLELHNSGVVRVRDWKVVVAFPEEFLLRQPEGPSSKVRIKHPPGQQFDAVQLIATNAGAGPLFPGDSVSVARIDWRVDDALYALAERTDAAMRWQIFADDLSVVCGEALIRRIHTF